MENSQENLLLLARRAMQDENYYQAQKYYEQLLAINPLDWESYFFSVYCQLSQDTKVGQILDATKKLKNVSLSSLDLILEKNIENKEDALKKVLDYTRGFIERSTTNVFSMYWQFRGSYLTTWHNYCLLAIDTLIELADKVDALQLISESLKTVKIKSWEKATSLMEELICSYYYDKKVIKTKKEVYLRKIKIAKGLDPDAEDQKPQTAGCYIATAVYGSYDCPEVWTLRRYRDDDLGSNFFGRLFIKIYYAISPTLVKLFGKTKWFKKMWKKILDKKVEKLNDNGVDNTPYEDKKW